MPVDKVTAVVVEAFGISITMLPWPGQNIGRYWRYIDLQNEDTRAPCKTT
jgi:hypothetical protein